MGLEDTLIRNQGGSSEIRASLYEDDMHSVYRCVHGCRHSGKPAAYDDDIRFYVFLCLCRDLFAGQIEKIIAESGRLLSQERAAESIASDITVIVKGLSYEFYTQGKEYDLVGETERILRMVIPTLL